MSLTTTPFVEARHDQPLRLLLREIRTAAPPARLQDLLLAAMRGPARCLAARAAPQAPQLVGQSVVGQPARNPPHRALGRRAGGCDKEAPGAHRRVFFRLEIAVAQGHLTVAPR